MRHDVFTDCYFKLINISLSKVLDLDTFELGRYNCISNICNNSFQNSYSPLIMDVFLDYNY